jgi:hypothetical protein
MQRNEEVIPDEDDDFVVLRSGGRYKRLKTGAEKGDPCSEYEWRGPCTVVHIIEVPCIEEGGE